MVIDSPEINLVSQVHEPVAHSLIEGLEFAPLPDIDLTQGSDMEAELMPYTSQEAVDAGLIYAPYVPLYHTPSLHISDITGVGEDIFVINKYDDIYSDIKERFEILDL